MPSSSDKRRVRFERHPAQVVFDPSDSEFVVTWSKCGMPIWDRLKGKRDPKVWIPSVMAVASLYDRGCVPQEHVLAAARAVGRALSEGDREGLDTESSRNAAEMVKNLSAIHSGSSDRSVEMDVGQAMRTLLDEMAAVRLMNTDMSELEDERVMPVMERASGICFSIDGFGSWPAYGMRRRFVFCLNRHERTDVAYTLAALVFDDGACPLLSLNGRRTVRMRSMAASGMDDGEFSRDSFSSFFRHALWEMREMKDSGSSSPDGKAWARKIAESFGAKKADKGVLE